jgi:hypothetical protein
MTNRLTLAVTALIAVLTVSGCSSAGDGGSGGSSKKPSSGISKGVGTKDASGDIKVGKGVKDAALGWVSVPVTITNHSSKRSDYFVDLAIESADGSTQYDTTTVFAQAVEPGQKATEKGQFTKDGIPVTAKIVIKSVQRTASN